MLGYVGGVTKRPDGGYDMIIRYGGLWGIGSRPIAVPVEALALLGPYVATVGITPAQLNALPSLPSLTNDAVSPGHGNLCRPNPPVPLDWKSR